MTGDPGKERIGANLIGYSDLKAATMDGIWLIDTEGRFLDVNDIYCRMSGYSREELLTLSVPDLEAETTREETARHIRQLIATGSHRFESRHRRKDGRIIDVEIAATFLQSSGCLIVFIHDISKRKRAERLLEISEKRYRRLFETAQDGILIINTETGCIIDANPFIINMLGYPLSDITGKELWEIGFIEDKSLAQKAFNELKKSRYIRYEDLPLKTRDGRHLNVEFVSNVYTVNGLSVIQCNIRDITDRKRADDALALASKKLNLLGQITRHDLLNQLMSLKGFIALSREKTTDAGMREYIEKEAGIAATIERQISFMKEYQNLGMNAPIWLDIKEEIKRAVQGLAVRDIQVVVDIPDLEVFADPLFEKVLYNLIDNALRYGGETLKTIRFSSHETEEGLILFCEDDGAGIVQEDKTRLFTKGFGKNTGLGLFLSREILSITGISISENGIPGKGARFEILVPAGAYRFANRPAPS